MCYEVAISNILYSEPFVPFFEKRWSQRKMLETNFVELIMFFF